METSGVAKETDKGEGGNPGFNPPLTRRQTMIWGGASLVGLSALGATFAQGSDRPLIIMEQARGLVIADPVLCVGCGRCELACTEFNDGKAAPARAHIKIDRNLNYGPQGVPAWPYGHGNMGDGLILQDLCRQCPHPVPCANICPENAIVLAPDTNARIIDPKKCTGCLICLQACPWEMISFDPERRQATKCHLCAGKPKCVDACPSGALSYVPWRDLTGQTPPRHGKKAVLPPHRSHRCGDCHLPGQRHSIRELGALIRRTLVGGRINDAGGVNFKWIDIAGLVLIPLAVAGVLVHALLRKVTKR